MGWLSQPWLSGHGVVTRGGTQLVVHAQGASFSLPQVCDAWLVPAGHCTAGRAGHSLSAHAR
jgi:hypothetical protein